MAVGLDPNTQLAKSSRLETDPQYGGYRVNAELQACSDIWVVGAYACTIHIRIMVAKIP